MQKQLKIIHRWQNKNKIRNQLLLVMLHVNDKADSFANMIENNVINGYASVKDACGKNYRTYVNAKVVGCPIKRKKTMLSLTPKGRRLIKNLNAELHEI